MYNIYRSRNSELRIRTDILPTVLMQLEQKLHLSIKFGPNRSGPIQTGCRNLKEAWEDEISLMNVTIQCCTY